jgi:lipopolysaccharide transport system ATP-binding protein
MFGMNKSIVVQNLIKEFYRGHALKQSVKEYFLNPFHKVERESFRAINDISFSVGQGEFFGIIGRNGSGKSTLLKMLAGVLEPTSGSVTLHGKLIPFLELGVGFNPELTARENVFLNGTILGMTRKHIEKKFDEIIEFAEVTDFVDTQLKNFSSGMYVRLAFAIAIQAEADIYLIDEILAVGDYNFQQKCFNLFRKLKKEGKTFIFVSHDLGAVREFCDRVMYIKYGEVLNIGKTRNVVEDYVVNDRKVRKNTTAGGDLSARLLGPNGKAITSLSSTTPFSLEISYKLSEKALKDKLIVGVIIYKDEDLHIFGTNSQIEPSNLTFSSEGTLTFTFKDSPLLFGHYTFSVAIHNQEGLNYVWKDNIAMIDVIKDHPRDGIVNFDVAIS